MLRNIPSCQKKSIIIYRSCRFSPAVKLVQQRRHFRFRTDCAKMKTVNHQSAFFFFDVKLDDWRFRQVLAAGSLVRPARFLFCPRGRESNIAAKKIMGSRTSWTDWTLLSASVDPAVRTRAKLQARALVWPWAGTERWPWQPVDFPNPKLEMLSKGSNERLHFKTFYFFLIQQLVHWKFFTHAWQLKKEAVSSFCPFLYPPFVHLRQSRTSW